MWSGFWLDLYPGRKPPGRGDQQENQQWRKISDPWKRIRLLGDLVQEIFREMKEKSEFYQESVKGYLLAFLMESGPAGRMKRLVLCFQVEDLPVVGKQSWKEEIRQVEAALRYVEERYSRAASGAGDLAAVCGLSETHFRRLFSKEHAADADGICE